MNVYINNHGDYIESPQTLEEQALLIERNYRHASEVFFENLTFDELYEGLSNGKDEYTAALLRTLKSGEDATPAIKALLLDYWNDQIESMCFD